MKKDVTITVSTRIVKQLKISTSRARILVLFTFCGIPSFAQKLPNKQETSLWVPANIKIDGKLYDWGNQFQAYNHATDIFYSMANDDRCLYLVIQATTPDIIDRITDGDITLVIQKTNKGDKKGNVTITYPIVDQLPYLVYGQEKTM